MAGFNWYPTDCTNLVIDNVPRTLSCSLQEIQLRFLCPDDVDEVRTLCRDWFPIEYPLTWYEDITSSERYYALAAVYNGSIIGLIVSEIKPFVKLNKEDRGILPRWFAMKSDVLVAYILSLGVARSHRRVGVGSLLLDTLISHLSSPLPSPPYENKVKALFLHVLTTNTEAILFYQHRKYFHGPPRSMQQTLLAKTCVLELCTALQAFTLLTSSQFNIKVQGYIDAARTVFKQIQIGYFKITYTKIECMFHLHSFLPYYYSIEGRCKDGFTYVYYINGGHPPWGL